ncbi:hypothetical protein EVG20_g974 [Dentipellis fragilis]|uniref:peptidylprolyl isomerase n=1 Tax=Dentipellis fragilis TaxID=205917 RepID=A0A4Y9ZDH8_9AGAM|nr:hypothetical protein EVG20_g974 [Dentipellis fragilis]
MVRPRVFMDFAIDNNPVGRVIFELYNDTAPKTAENFRALCTGEKGLSPLSDRPLYYKNSIIHRSIANFMIQGGDFTKRNGTGGESIYGAPFADEDLTLPLDSEGLLCMANKGPNTNNSQFFITLRDCPHLNGMYQLHIPHYLLLTPHPLGRHVVFGKVIRGYDEVVKKITDVPVDEKDRPTVPVTIVNCGELELRKRASAPPPKERAESEDASESESESEPERKRHKRRHRSRSPDDSDDDKRRKTKHKHKHRKDKHVSRSKSKSADANPDGEKPEGEKGERKETEEEYDARLEREENGRFEAARRRELERIARLHEQEAQSQNTNGVRFKGRGRMKYVDPELHQHH